MHRIESTEMGDTWFNLVRGPTFCMGGFSDFLQVHLQITWTLFSINPLNTKRRLLYLKTQFVPRSKHFSSQL